MAALHVADQDERRKSTKRGERKSVDEAPLFTPITAAFLKGYLFCSHWAVNLTVLLVVWTVLTLEQYMMMTFHLLLLLFGWLCTLHTLGNYRNFVERSWSECWWSSADESWCSSGGGLAVISVLYRRRVLCPRIGISITFEKITQKTRQQGEKNERKGTSRSKRRCERWCVRELLLQLSSQRCLHLFFPYFATSHCFTSE